MSKDETIRTGSRITGAPRQGTFERACYAVRNHGDGTGTVVLDWYEMSDGRDYCASDEFMRAEIDTARQVVEVLNRQLSGRVLSAPTEIDWRVPSASNSCKL
jgi:hypothetical protein